MKDHILGEGAVEWQGTLYKIILDREATGGAMSITDSVSPADSGPPRHVHDREDETFVVLTGECTFWLEGRSFSRGPGETAFVPRGCAHTFKVTSDRPSRHLVILTPGGFEDFFAEMATGGYTLPGNMAAVEESAARYGLRFTGPPL